MALQQEREAARCALPDDAELPVVHPGEAADLGQVAAYQRQVMALVEAADDADAPRRVGVADPATQRIARVRRVRNDAAPAEHRRRQPDQPGLRMRRMKLQQLRHEHLPVVI